MCLTLHRDAYNKVKWSKEDDFDEKVFYFMVLVDMSSSDLMLILHVGAFY